MTHPTPTTGMIASPPPRGEGMGVGGCPLAIIATLLLTTPAAAQILSTGTPAADILLSQAITEHRVFLTCSALDAATHDRIAANWQTDVDKAASILTAQKVAPEAIAAFTAAAAPKALLPAEDTSFAEVRQFCSTQADWQTASIRMNFTILELKLPGAFPE